MSTLDEDEAALAGELSLRILPPAEEAAARDRAARDPVFAAEVGRWDERFGALFDEVGPVRPSDAVWPGVESAAFGANDNGRVAFWRAWAIGATGLLAASVVGLVVMITAPEPPATVPPTGVAVTRVATLELEGGAAALTLVYDSVTGKLYLAPSERMPGDDRIPHLWLVMPEGGVQLVGAIDGSETSQRSLGAALSTMAGQATAVAVSMEAPGHTPASDKPDGPVVASGALRQL